MKQITVFIIFYLVGGVLFGQNLGAIAGYITDKNTKEALIGASIFVEGTELGTTADIDGSFRLEEIPVGSYNITASYVGYRDLTLYNIVINSGNDNIINFDMEEEAIEIEGAEVVANRSISITTGETPNSIQRVSTEEIKANPGGNFDISKVVNTLPGVASNIGVGAFRNDIIIRGGAPNENVYFLDGIEVPNINHFSTQGSAGGPQGMLNVSFIEGVTLSTSSMHARYDNALSSVLQFDQRTGNPNQFQGNVRLSSTELAVTLEGPVKDKVTYLVSARRSYLQFLFELIDLPIRPNYWDFQYKINYKPTAKTTVSFIGLGSIDDFSFATPENSTPESEYIIRSNPLINQWSYTTGVNVRHLIEDGYLNIALSRNMFNNELDKFADGNDGNEDFRTLESRSQEIENKLRVDVNKYKNGWKYSYGATAQYVKYNNDYFDSSFAFDTIQFNTDINFAKFGLFGQVSRRFVNDRLNVSLGTRMDMNTFTDTGMNPLKAWSFRLGTAYEVNDKWKVSASAGTYYKIPIYTVLGFRDENDVLVNKDNDYIRSIHTVVGAEFIPAPKTRITAEAFYKKYDNYPISDKDGISIANQGSDFGAIGNESVSSEGEGRAYGIEMFLQQKLSKNFFGVFSYTWYRSEYTGFNGEYVPSAWDYRHLMSLSVGYKLNKGWELGAKYRFAAGAPYTPFDMDASRAAYAVSGRGVLDYSRLNGERLPAFNQLDFRVDKKFNFKKWTLDIYLDVVNALAFALPNESAPSYTFKRLEDGSDWDTTDGQPLLLDGSNAQPILLRNEDNITTPSIGFIIEF